MVFEFKIKLKGSAKPPIWRKIKVNENITFHDLHRVIQAVFDWEDYHLYQFSPKGWGSTPCLQEESEDDWLPEDEMTPAKMFPNGRMFNAAEVKLNQYFVQEKQKMVYIYDFGDDWEHEIVLEKITDEIMLHPICTAGKGNSPVEDCGGIWGYYNMVEAINDPKHEEHKDYMRWLGLPRGSEWDVHEFDIELANENIREQY